MGAAAAALAAGLTLAFLLALDLSRPHVGGDALRYDTFVALVTGGRVDDARILDQDAYVVGTYERDDGARAPYNAPLVRGTQADLLQLLVDARVPTTIDQQVGKQVAALATVLLPPVILVVLFVYLVLSYRRGSGLFGVRSGARRAAQGPGPAVTFADVAGQDAAVAELREVRDFLADPAKFAGVGAAVPKGVLLYGPPGCGKTLLARALASESGASFWSISGSDFVEVYVGVGASRVRDLFKQARADAPAIVFIDELDSVGRARAGSGALAQGSHAEQEQSLNQLLAEMDGFSASEGVIVLGATNRPDVLDPALLRPGRFDRSIGLERPDRTARLAILERHAARKRMAPGVDLAAVAERAIGLTGADLASVMNEGALLAAREGRGDISQAELDQALQRILEAPERQRRLSMRGRSVGRRYSSEHRVTFADVAGADDAVAELEEVSGWLTEPDRYAAMGARPPRGILLAGPPGTGKTLLARAVAGEANAAFYSVAATEFVEVFAGEGASRVRELFAEARSVAPSIVFIDEIDAIGARRSGAGMAGDREHDQTLNQILVELDGFEAGAAVTAIAATNRPDILDPALIRPGRFDRQITVALPDRAGRAAILRLHARGKQLGTAADLDAVAALTRGFSGADLASVLNEAALLAVRRGAGTVDAAHLEEAVERVLMGVSSRGLLLTEGERRIVACHEAGHALVALAVAGEAALHKLTIAPLGPTLGRCTTIEAHDRVIRSRSMLVDQVTILLGGWAAERAAFGEAATGSALDLQRANDLARRMACEFGMSDDLGPRVLAPGAGTPADAGGPQVQAAIGRILDEAAKRATDHVSACGGALARVTDALVDRETLSAAEVLDLACPR